MSDELRRLHRKTNPFTNFSDGQSNESPGSTQDSTQDSLDSQPPRRRRRRRSDSQLPIIDNDQPINIALKQEDNTSDLKRSVESPIESPQQDYDEISSQPQLNISFATNEQSINAIRAELLEDRHHQDITESDYSNDTHDWGDTTYFNSDEYWNFLGRYE